MAARSIRFKNYILRQDTTRLTITQEHLATVRGALALYNRRPLNEVEKLAVVEITGVINTYAKTLKTVTRFAATGATGSECRPDQQALPGWRPGQMGEGNPGSENSTKLASTRNHRFPMTERLAVRQLWCKSPPSLCVSACLYTFLYGMLAVRGLLRGLITGRAAIHQTGAKLCKKCCWSFT